MNKLQILHDGLRIIKVSKSYGNKKVVRDISLNIKQGSIVGLLGPNGAGKTTTFYMIVGLIKTENGSIILNKINITNMPIYLRGEQGISYLPQEPSIFRGMNVEDNLISIIEIKENDKLKHNIILNNLLDEFELQHVRKSKSIVLSGGERRLLEISRALVMKPSVLLVDEPSIGLEPRYIDMVFEILGDLQQNEKKTIILVEQNAKKGLEFADIGYVLVSGQTAIAGKGDDLLNNPDVGRLFLGG